MGDPYDEEPLRVTPETLSALEDVAAERERQEAKWGEQNHDPFLYLSIIGEEYGEACEAALEARFPGQAADPGALRKELIQVAASAVAAVESLDRAKWYWGAHAQDNTEDADDE